MTSLYNRIAGRSRERLAALSDGVFAFAMTVLVLDLRPPAAALIHSEGELGQALWVLAPHLVPFLMSFMTLGIFWVGQQTQHDALSHTDRSYTWFHIGFLMAVCLLPFSTSLLAEFIEFRIALLVYWANLLLLGLLLLAGWYRAKWFGLVRNDAPLDIDNAFIRRVVVAQALYAFGAVLCVFSTWWSIGFIFAVQINYVIAPRFKPFSWL
ncbi:MAG TPA: TMEM175 family protein [Micropepsaceae bacterium]|nr:TMEM175 family protein [Micropepsaceae bacterium]